MGTNIAHFPVTVMHDPSTSPSSISSFSTAGIPPTPWRSSMTYFPLGLRSAKKGTLSETCRDEKTRNTKTKHEKKHNQGSFRSELALWRIFFFFLTSMCVGEGTQKKKKCRISIGRRHFFHGISGFPLLKSWVLSRYEKLCVIYVGGKLTNQINTGCCTRMYSACGRAWMRACHLES